MAIFDALYFRLNRRRYTSYTSHSTCKMPTSLADIDCRSSCLNYLLPEQRDFVTKLRRANTYGDSDVILLILAAIL